MSRRMIALLGVLTSVLLVVGILIGFITLYKDTQCTTVLGTQVCRTYHLPSRPSPVPVSHPATVQGPGTPLNDPCYPGSPLPQCTPLPGPASS